MNLCRLVFQRAAPELLAVMWLVSSPLLAEESVDGAQRMADRKSISFINTASPYCHQPDSRVDRCFIGFAWHAVSSSSYMVKLQVSIGGRRVVEDRGFFQSGMFIDQTSLGGTGYRVSCGLTGAGGSSDPMVGLVYDYAIRAEDSEGLTSQNFGTIGCPAFLPPELFRNGFEGS